METRKKETILETQPRESGEVRSLDSETVIPIHNVSALKACDSIQGNLSPDSPHHAANSQKNSPILDNSVEHSVPWDLRAVGSADSTPIFGFLSNRFFWGKIDFALRVALLCILPTSLLLNLEATKHCFTSTPIMTMGSILGYRATVGETVSFLFHTLSGAVFVLPVGTAVSLLNLHQNGLLWGVAYALLTFIFGALCIDDRCKRISLLLLTVSCVGHYRTMEAGVEDVWLTSRLVSEFFLGVGFGVFAQFFPYPRRATQEVDTTLHAISRDISLCFAGLCDSFWCGKNMDRNVNLVRIRFAKRALEQNFHELQESSKDSMTEPELLHTTRERESKRYVFEQLNEILLSMLRVVENLSQVSDAVLNSRRMEAWANTLSIPLKDLVRDAEAICFGLGETGSLKDADLKLSSLETCLDRFEDKILDGRRRINYGLGRPPTPQEVENNALINFFNFHVRTFCTVLLAIRSSKQERPKCLPLWKTYLLKGPKDLIDRIFRYVTFQYSNHDLRRLKESFKTSLALTLSVAFFAMHSPRYAWLTGPTIVCFVASDDPGSAVVGAAQRLFGTLMGAVIGFSAGSLVHSTTGLVIASCVTLFAFNLARTGKAYGTAAFYGCFVLVGMLTPGIDTDEAIVRIMQNTFSVMIYIVISLLLFPTSARAELIAQRTITMKHLAASLSSCLAVFGKRLSSICDLETSLSAMKKSLALESTWLSLAEDEPDMRRTPYPVYSSGKLHRVFLNMHAILETSSAAWKLMFSVPSVQEVQSSEKMQYRSPSQDKIVLRRNSVLRPNYAAIQKGIINGKCHEKHHLSEAAISILSTLEPVGNEIGEHCKSIVCMLIISLLKKHSALASEIVSHSTKLTELINVLRHYRDRELRGMIQHALENVAEEAGSSTKLSSVEDLHSQGSVKDEIESSKPFLSCTEFLGHQSISMKPDDDDLCESTQFSTPYPKHQPMPIRSEEAEGVHAVIYSLSLFAAELREALLCVEDLQQAELAEV